MNDYIYIKHIGNENSYSFDLFKVTGSNTNKMLIVCFKGYKIINKMELVF